MCLLFWFCYFALRLNFFSILSFSPIRYKNWLKLALGTQKMVDSLRLYISINQQIWCLWVSLNLGWMNIFRGDGNLLLWANFSIFQIALVKIAYFLPIFAHFQYEDMILSMSTLGVTKNIVIMQFNCASYEHKASIWWTAEFFHRNRGACLF